MRTNLSRMVGSRLRRCATTAFGLTARVFWRTVTVTAFSGKACALRKLLRTARASASCSGVPLALPTSLLARPTVLFECSGDDAGVHVRTLSDGAGARLAFRPAALGESPALGHTSSVGAVRLALSWRSDAPSRSAQSGPEGPGRLYAVPWESALRQVRKTAGSLARVSPGKPATADRPSLWVVQQRADFLIQKLARRP